MSWSSSHFHAARRCSFPSDKLLSRRRGIKNEHSSNRFLATNSHLKSPEIALHHTRDWTKAKLSATLPPAQDEGGPWQLTFLHFRPVQDDAGIHGDEPLGGSEQWVEADHLDRALLDHEPAEVGQKPFEGVAIDQKAVNCAICSIIWRTRVRTRHWTP
jgi:hypothetical protein